MATRSTIKKSFFDKLTTAVDGLNVPVRENDRRGEADVPAVIYDMDIRRLPINDASASPSYIKYDSGGNVEYEEYRSHWEGLFTIFTRATDSDEAETIFENLIDELGKLEHRHVAGPTDLHDHVNYVAVTDTTDNTDTAAEHPHHGDAVQVLVRFFRGFRLSTDTIQTIDADIQP